MATIREHLKGRYLDMDLHTVWIDEDQRVATFPLWNLSGKLVGYQAYRPDADKVRKNDEKGRYYTYKGLRETQPRVFHHEVAVWGLESFYLTPTLFVTEGIFNATRFTDLGVSCIAVLSNDPSDDTRNWLMAVRQDRKVVSICDPGKGGRKARSLGHTYHTVELPGDPDGDLGDAPDSYVKELLRCYL